MLSRRHGSISLRQCHRHHGCRSYSNKVRVFPFVVSKEQAIQALSMNTAVFTGHKIIRTYLQRLFPGLNIDGLRPTRIQPAYLPTWLIDAQVHATAWLKNSQDESESRRSDVEVQFAHTSMPGLVHFPLSANCFAMVDLLRTQPVQWSENMRRHDGEEVQCPPFTVSPFRLIEAARSLPLADANIFIIRYEPSSIRDSMMAAYAVLFPIYLAQFTVQTRVNSRQQDYVLSAYIEAARPEPRLYIELTPAATDFFKRLGFLSSEQEDNGPPGYIIRGSAPHSTSRFTNVRSILGNNVTLEHRRYTEYWIDSALKHGDPLRQYHRYYFAKSSGSIDWEDVRIRPFTVEERTVNMRWLESAEDLFVLEKLLKVYGQKREARPKPFTNIEATPHQIQAIRDKAESLKKEREENKPEWLVQYEIQQGSLAKPPAPGTGTRP